MLHWRGDPHPAAGRDPDSVHYLSDGRCRAHDRSILLWHRGARSDSRPYAQHEVPDSLPAHRHVEHRCSNALSYAHTHHSPVARPITHVDANRGLDARLLQHPAQCAVSVHRARVDHLRPAGHDHRQPVVAVRRNRLLRRWRQAATRPGSPFTSAAVPWRLHRPPRTAAPRRGSATGQLSPATMHKARSSTRAITASLV